jgi:hypothetical protein
MLSSRLFIALALQPAGLTNYLTPFTLRGLRQG